MKLTNSLLLTLLVVAISPVLVAAAEAEARAEVKNVSLNGGIEDGKARLVIEAILGQSFGAKEKLLFDTTLDHAQRITREKIAHTIHATFDILQGQATEIPLTISGEGEFKKVTGENLLDWSVRQGTNGARSLVLRTRKADLPKFTVEILAEREMRTWANPMQTFSLAPERTALFHGFVKLEVAPELDAAPSRASGLTPIEPTLLPEGMRGSVPPPSGEGQVEGEVQAFQFHASAYFLPLIITLADPEARRVTLRDFRLEGKLQGGEAEFILSATAKVQNPRGGALSLFSGGLALADLDHNPDWKLNFQNGQFVLRFERAGEFPLRIRFNAAVQESGGKRSVDFRVTPGVLAPLRIQGLKPDTEIEFAGAARPDRVGDAFQTFLPPDGAVRLSWKEARPEVEGKLFFAAEMLSQITISPGLMRQFALIDGKVMQGELDRVAFVVSGPGNITAVQGPNLLAWHLEPVTNSTDRRLVVRFNQPQKDQFTLQAQLQSELGAFPQAVEAVRIRPEGATRFAGHFRVVNQGAVRLEILEAIGLSQISPEHFPENDRTKALFGLPATQRFAFRFSSPEFSLRIQADNVLPEVSVSELLVYHLGETELAIEGEFELDIREAPLRESSLRVPKGFAIARLTAPGLNDYFLREPEGENQAELRLIYGQPISGRQVIQLRLERNAPLAQTNWALPRVEVSNAKSTRGHIAISADPGFRLTPETTSALTEIATAFFPRKINGIQAAFRLTEPAWQASPRVERVPQTVQADVFHLFSVGEGIAYGSSMINYFISGAPVSAFLVSVSEEYFNVEFTGKDLRGNWQKTTNGYLVSLNTPVSGSYTLLVTYERPFKAQGDTLTFTGARPLDARAEQGHTLVVSAYQFQVKPVTVTPGLMALETTEVPPEYRLFFDAPILAAYRYTSRPFNLQLALSPLAQGETLGLVVDRAALTTRISRDGEVLTDARYFLKNRGHTHLRLELPAGVTLWSARVNNATVTPVKDGSSHLIPLSQQADPNSVQTLDLKLASRSTTPARVTAAAPIMNAPVLLAQWDLQPDTGQRLAYRGGSLAPAGGVQDLSGFAGLAQMFRSNSEAALQFSVALGLIIFALWAWRWASRNGAHRYGVRHIGGSIAGIAAFILAGAVFAQLWQSAARVESVPPAGLTFLAPIQQSGSALRVEVANASSQLAFWPAVRYAWPALGGLFLWFSALFSPGWLRPVVISFGWTFIAWAALRWPNGAKYVLVVLFAYLLIHVLLPGLRALLRVPVKAAPAPAAPNAFGTATAALALGFLIWNCLAAPSAQAQTTLPASTRDQAIAESVTQDIRVEGDFALATARIRWHAAKNQLLPVLFDPAVLTRTEYPTNALKLIHGIYQAPATAGQGQPAPRRAHQFLAREDGSFDILLEYQIRVVKKENESGFLLPSQYGLVNRADLTLSGLDVDVSSTNAVSAQRRASGTNATKVTLVLAPKADSWIYWKPRSRDVKLEKAVLFADFVQLYVPSAGVIEGAHQAQIRPAQGEFSELAFDVPDKATISDVSELGDNGQPLDLKTSNISLWRFDPDTRKLRVTLRAPHSRPLTLLIRSQLPAGPLPFEQTAGLLRLNDAAGQVGSAGIATGPEVQLDNATASPLPAAAVAKEGFAAINLEDFPPALLQTMTAHAPGLTLRRAFRYTDPRGSIMLQASAVQPDVRVETQETLSLGEDRTVLALNATVNITRAGIFRISFSLPATLEVESISGGAMSHWTELKSPEGRIITLHLQGKTEGQQQFSLTLSGQGVKSMTNFVAPKVLFREASKQRGQLVIVPEQGMRLQVGGRDGVTQLDPQKAGLRQKGVLAFRLLQPQWTLALNIEQVDAWVQVTSLQHLAITEAQVKSAANLQYQIENTGLKSFLVRLPAIAESVRFRGDQVADFQPVGQVTNELQVWEVKLHRRVIGRYLLQATWQTTLSESTTNFLARGLEALDANLQRGFVTVQSSGRLQVRASSIPAALQPAEWQSIPRLLRQDIEASSANYTFRLVEPSYALPLALERHEATKLLPARVSAVTLTSVISDEGVMLTQARIDLFPGDKRLLHLTLPGDAKFWFAFVNQNGVWPWREQDKILIPLEPQTRPDQPSAVELFYSSRIGNPGKREFDLALHGPKFDLPLENITWQVYLNEKWRLEDWTGTLQLQEDTLAIQPVAIDVQSYLENESNIKREKTKVAEQMLQMGNSLLEKGDPQQARRAFQNAFGLSAHDQAFNEDARVQLHNLKLQQALIGLNVRQSAVAGEAAPAQAQTQSQMPDVRNRKEAAYTQQEAKQIIDSNTADDNAALMRLAERLVQQQDAAVPAPTAIRAAIPQQGRLLTFRRAVQVDPWVDLTVNLEAVAARTAPLSARTAILAAAFVLFSILIWFSGSLKRAA